MKSGDNTVIDLSEAKLPKVGLPKQWDATAEKQKNVLYEPGETISKQGAYYDILGKPIMITDRKTSLKKARLGCIGFIESSKEAGKSTHHAVTNERITQLQEADILVTDFSGKLRLPCLIKGGYYDIRAMEADHAHVKKDIFARQKLLIKKLNSNLSASSDAAFIEHIKKQSGSLENFNDLFKINPKTGKYMGTEYFYNLYYNDIENIWLICKAANNEKSSENLLETLKTE